MQAGEKFHLLLMTRAFSERIVLRTFSLIRPSVVH